MTNRDRRRDLPASSMTIREAFAMHVLAGLEATMKPTEIRDPHFARYVEWRVDTMLDRLHTPDELRDDDTPRVGWSVDDVVDWGTP